MYCPQCGKPLKEGAVFCSSCGAKVQKQRRKQLLPWLLLGATLVIDAVLCAVLLTSGGGAPISADAEPAHTAAFTPAPTPTEAPVVRRELPDMYAWIRGTPGEFEEREYSETKRKWLEQEVRCDDPNAFFSYIELLSDERYALEPIYAKPVFYEYNDSDYDYRVYTMPYRYVGEAAITRDAADPLWVLTYDLFCDVLVVCTINRQQYETEESDWKSVAVTCKLQAYPEATLCDAGKWNGAPPNNAPEAPTKRTFRVESYAFEGGYGKHDYCFSTDEAYLMPALEEAGVLGWKTVNGERRLYTVAGVPVNFSEGEEWALIFHSKATRDWDEIFVSDNFCYEFCIMKGDLELEEKRKSISAEPKENAVKFFAEATVNGERAALKIYTTAETMLGPVLRARGFVEGTEESWGFLIRKVAGIEADEAAGEFWAVYVDDEPLQTGIDSTPIAAKESYYFVLTK